jgi:hypothetical protein
MAFGSTNEILAAAADAVRDALETALSAESISVQVEPHMVANATPPVVDIYPGDVSKGTDSASFGEEGELLFTVRARVQGNDDVANWELLNDLMDDSGDLSIVAALDADETLSGYATSLNFTNPTGIVLYAYGQDTLPGRQFTLTVVRASS